MKNKKHIDPFISYQSHTWDLEFNYPDEPGAVLDIPSVELEKFINELPIESGYKSELKLESDYPKNGLFNLVVHDENLEFDKNYIQKLSLIAINIYKMAIEKSKNSPKKEDILFDLERIKKYSEYLYRALIETNYFTREFIHEDSAISREDDQLYIAAIGQGIPKNYRYKPNENNDWLKNLNGLRDFAEYLQNELNLAINPVKDSLFNKAVGSPDFILVWNAHVILALLDIELKATKNGIIPRFAQLLRDCAIGHPTSVGWPDVHVRSILEWRNMLKETRCEMIRVIDIIEKNAASEREKEDLLLRIQVLSDREGWLLANPGRVSAEHGSSRGNFTLYSDPTFPQTGQ